MNTILVNYEGALRCSTEHESGTVVLTNAPKEHHGTGESFSPSELLAVSLGSCILSTMGIAARAMRIEIPGATATIEKEMADAPRRIARLAAHIRVPGHFEQHHRQKLEAAAHACLVHNVLKVESPITFTWTDAQDATTPIRGDSE